VLTSCGGLFLRPDFWTVRLMAGVTGQPGGMIRGHDLREPLGFGAVFFVATGADYGSFEFRGLDAGVAGMIRERAVAGFAGDGYMFSRLLCVRDVGVAGFAGLMAGVDDRLGSNFRNCRSAKVTIFPKTTRNNRRAHNEECGESDQHDRGQPDQVFYVLEQVRLPGNAIRITFLVKLYIAWG
jgi:hypothetical protein